MGTGNQFRMVGGAIVIAISTSVLNSYVKPQLASLGFSGTNVLAELPSNCHLKRDKTHLGSRF